MKTLDVMDIVLAERTRQKEVWSTNHDYWHETNDWIAIIARYLGKLSFCDEKEEIREHMTKIAAVAVAALEANDD